MTKLFVPRANIVLQRNGNKQQSLELEPQGLMDCEDPNTAQQSCLRRIKSNLYYTSLTQAVPQEKKFL